MIRQINLLLHLELCNAFGLNEARFGKDAKKRRRILQLGAVFVFLGLVIAFYAGALAYGYVQLGLAELIPAYLLAVTSLLLLFFTLFKAGSILFNRNTYERVAPLPLQPGAIVISRFLSMYAANVLLSALILLPGCAVYAWFLHPGVSFYFMTLLGVFLLPLLPMTISSALGALIQSIAARMRHKNLAVIVLSLVLLAAIFGASFLLSAEDEAALTAQFASISALLLSKIQRVYPPAALFSDGLINGSWSAYALFAVGSIAIFVVFVLLVEWKFSAICSRLANVSAKRDYVMGALTLRSPLRALYRRELKRYFASSIYVLNTIIGGFLMIVFAVAFSFADLEKMEAGLSMPGLLLGIAPALLGAMSTLSPTTASSISLEGKQWWIAQSLPVPARTVLDSKLLVNLTIVLPGWAVSVLILILFAPVRGMQALWLTLLPLASALFGANLGLSVNLRFPMLNWESETVPVKQSTATMLCMLAGLAVAIVPIGLWVALPAVRDVIYPICTVLLAGGAAMLYFKNGQQDLKQIG